MCRPDPTGTGRYALFSGRFRDDRVPGILWRLHEAVRGGDVWQLHARSSASELPGPGGQLEHDPRHQRRTCYRTSFHVQPRLRRGGLTALKSIAGAIISIHFWIATYTAVLDVSTKTPSYLIQMYIDRKIIVCIFFCEKFAGQHLRIERFVPLVISMRLHFLNS